MNAEDEAALGERMRATAQAEDRARARHERVGGEPEPGAKSILRPRGQDGGLVRITEKRTGKASEPPV